LALLLLQPERRWTLQALAEALEAPQSSVHRELARAEAAGVIRRDAEARPHRFSAATDDAAYESLAELLRRTAGVESQLRASLDRADVVGKAKLSELRRLVRSIGRATGRTIDLTLMGEEEFRRLLAERSGFARQVMEAPVMDLVGDLGSLAR
jgi:DNA-binding MarR family transcriptional regulator